MKLTAKLFVLVFFISLLPALVQAKAIVHHKLNVKLDPAKQWFEASDNITLPKGRKSSEFVFYLHESLTVAPGQYSIEIIPHSLRFPVPVKAYRVRLDKDVNTLQLNYAGTIHHALASQGKEYARSFSETPGVISKEGVFLAGSSLWYPWMDETQVTFELTVNAPKDWKVISQGGRVQQVDDIQSWRETSPQEEIYLIAAPFHEYTRPEGRVTAMAFLRQDDQALANKYLEVTAQYLEMYSKLLGPYPYAKFALVENFWETGYGMPSFTLLGPRVIRMPFILHSSYPHEILHNWWGNGVYVDYQQGNWAEGLTSYLADHLIQEQRGAAAVFRRNILQNYADFVSAGWDFPLTEFTARHSSSSEAIGYGKAQMMFHMLRQMIGDDAFIHGLQQLYRRYRFEKVGFEDLSNLFQELNGQALELFFEQWLTRTGAPELVVNNVSVISNDTGWVLQGLLEQKQAGEAYEISVPLAVSMEGQDDAFQTNISMTGKQQPFTIELRAKPLRLDVDPEFDLFRRVSRAEIPPALSQAFGADQVLLVLPSKASPETKSAYEALAASWENSRFGSVDVKYDEALAALPDDKSVWLLGGNNRFADQVVKALESVGVKREGRQVIVGKNSYNPTNDSIVMTARRHSTDQHALVWLAADRAGAIPGLARKLPHYRKYSYLVFSGDEPTNQLKGQWPVIESPLSISFGDTLINQATLTSRQPLARLPALFDASRMFENVKILASAKMEGRGLASIGLDRTADYIAKEFREAGLEPGYPTSESYFQQWTDYVAGLDRDVKMTNVIGFIPGRNPDMASQSVVVGAHYDHLGFGWPDVREGSEGKLHAGADDNASGIAVMLELARVAAQGWQPERNIVFVAFTGEEAGRLGSQYFVSNYSRFPARKAIAMINLDTVGRLGEAPVTAFGSGSATEWVHIFRGIGFVTGLKVNGVAQDFGSSDQRSYLDIGIPAIQLFGTAHEDFHRPTDVINKLDVAGMIKVATVLKETVQYLANRPQPLTTMLSGNLAPVNLSIDNTDKLGRKVSMGTVPDFTYRDPGIRLTGVVPNSPADKAGMRKGDVIKAIDDQEILNLNQFASLLREMMPGQRLMVEYLRNGGTKKIELELMSR